MSFADLAKHGVRYCARCVGSFALWTVWLLLGLLLVVQGYVAATNELSVPDFVLHRLEERLAETGLRVTFDRATFDPTGRILVHSPRVYLPGIEDPIATAEVAYVGLDPWPLFLGRMEAREIRLIDGTIFVPALLSASGRAEPVVRDIDALVVPGQTEVALRHVSARIGTLVVSAHGAVAITHRAQRPPGELAALIRTRFREFCRASNDFVQKLEAFDQPSLDLRLEPTTTRGAIVSAELLGKGMKLDTPVAAELGPFRAAVRFPLLGNAPGISTLELSASEARLPKSITLRQAVAVIRGRINPAALHVEPVEVRAFAANVALPDIAAADVSMHLRSDVSAQWQGGVEARVLGAPLDLTGAVDLREHTANLAFAGGVSPKIVDVISARTHVDVRKFFGFDSFTCERGSAQFGPEWKFQRAAAHVMLRGINAHGVKMDDGFADVQVDPHRLYAPVAYARLGENFARGSYEHEFGTQTFRFLLDGRLRPMDISGWFHPWWSHFFQRFEFPAAPPAASVDVQGVWREGRRTSVFVFMDAKDPVVVGQKLQRARTRLFVRPGFYDGLDVHAVDVNGGTANGVFTLSTELGTSQWRSFDIQASSTLAFDAAAKMFAGMGHPMLAPFALAQPPAVTLHGHFDGPAVTGPRHSLLDLTAHSSGEFRFHDFPLQDVAFTLAWRDDEITIDHLEGRFAGGALRGKAKVWGPSNERRLGFDASVKDASLGQAVSAVQNYSAERKGLPRPPPGKFVREKTNVRLDLAASADGFYGEPFSLHGEGNALLRGPEIGEVPIFGPLSDLLKFTALRFTTGEAKFKINGPKLEFPQIALRGANSAIDAHGEYALDRRQLDFRAKVFPFQESSSVIKNVVGAVLAPISNALEVKLTGTLENPDWAFVIGPTNLFRSLAPNQPEAAPETKPAPASAKGKTPPANAAAAKPEGTPPAASPPAEPPKPEPDED